MIQNTMVCPVCGKELSKEIRIDNRDIIYVACNACGTYALSREFYEDDIDQENAADTRARLANFLFTRKDDKAHPFITNCGPAPDGYSCFPYFTCR